MKFTLEECLKECLRFTEAFSDTFPPNNPQQTPEYYNNWPACEWVVQNYSGITVGSNQRHCECEPVCPLRTVWDPEPPRSQRYHSKGCWGNRGRSLYYRYANAETDKACYWIKRDLILAIKVLIHELELKTQPTLP